MSASLKEEQRSDLFELGLDGWLLKPVDGGRLQALLTGTIDIEQRGKDMYVPGQWERGGWLGPNEGDGPTSPVRIETLQHHDPT